MSDLPIIQKTYDLIKWYVPILERLPKNHKFGLGDRIVSGLYDLLEGLILARYAREKLGQLELLFDERRYEYAGQLINEIGNELGGWIKQQRQVRHS